MAVPAIVWRNPVSVNRPRLWSRARTNEASTVFIIVRSAGSRGEWEGLPNLEVLSGGAPSAKRAERSNARSGS